LLFNFALEYFIRRVHGICCGVNILVENIDTIQKNTELLLDVGKEVGLEVNPEESKYIC
jgi:hypothetical protein